MDLTLQQLHDYANSPLIRKGTKAMAKNKCGNCKYGKFRTGEKLGCCEATLPARLPNEDNFPQWFIQMYQGEFVQSHHGYVMKTDGKECKRFALAT